MAVTIYGKTVDSGLIAGHAWRSAIDVVAKMPVLIVSAMVLSLAFNFVLRDARPFFDPTLRGGAPQFVAIGIIGVLLDAVVQAPVAVAVHRLILRRETSNGIVSLRPVRTRHFIAWLVLFGLCANFLSMLRVLIRPLGLATLTTLPLAIFLAFAGVRLSLIFPAVAIEARTDGWRDRARKSWQQTQGHFWLLFWADLLAAVPLAVIAVIVLPALILGSLHGPQSQLASTVMMIFSAVQRTISVAVGAAVLSWTYRFLVAGEQIAA
jgi:hypothetical protein